MGEIGSAGEYGRASGTHAQRHGVHVGEWTRNVGPFGEGTSYRNSDAHSDSDTNPDTNPDSNTNTYANSDPDANSYADSNTYTNSDANANTWHHRAEFRRKTA